MSDKDLIKKLKLLVFDETQDEHDLPSDGLKIGLLENNELYNEIVSIMEYYKNRGE